VVTFQKYLVYILSSILMGASIIFIPEVANSLSTIYALVIGAFLGIDMATTILKTKSLPEGEFKEAKKDRYIVCSLMSSVLVTIAFYVKEKTQANLLDTITMLSMTLMGIGAIFIALMESNKLVTGTKKEE
jgi:hypothetical protein